MKEFFDYIKNPTLCEERKIDWGMFGKLYLSYYAFGVLVVILYGVLYLFGLPIEKPHDDLSYTFWERILKIAIITPVLEETLFRFPLRNGKRYAVILWGVLLILLAYGVYKGNNFLLYAMTIYIIFFLIVLLTKLYEKIDFKYFFYFSCLAFGLVHITNFSEFYFWTPLLVLPQLALGSILGFLRMRYGFLYGILFHVLVNLPGAMF